jgi:hypothetical protein
VLGRTGGGSATLYYNNADFPGVFVSSALGNIYAFAPGAAAGGGPLWKTADLRSQAIPADALPSSTYSFLSATIAGTLLVTTTAGGANWQTEKAFVAIVNGVFPPPGAAARGLSSGAAAGIAIGVLAGAGALAALAYLRVPAFASTVDGLLASVGVGGGGGSGKAFLGSKAGFSAVGQSPPAPASSSSYGSTGFSSGAAAATAPPTNAYSSL